MQYLASITMYITLAILAWFQPASPATARPASGSGHVAAQPPEFHSDRSVLIGGVITGQTLVSFDSALTHLTAEGNTGDIDVVISSPGGIMTVGFMMINLMEDLRARGVRFRCFVPTIAASMAFQLLVHCDERFTTSKALLLWHGARVVMGGGMFSPGVEMTQEKAESLGADLAASNRVILDELHAVLDADMPTATVNYHFLNETAHIGSSLAAAAPGFIQAFPALPGTLSPALKALLSRPASPMEGVYQPGTFVHICDSRCTRGAK